MGLFTNAIQESVKNYAPETYKLDDVDPIEPVAEAEQISMSSPSQVTEMSINGNAGSNQMNNDPIVGVNDPNPTLASNESAQSGPSLQELYPTAPTAEGPGTVNVGEVAGADTVNADPSVAEIGTEDAQAAQVGDVAGAETTEADLGVGDVTGGTSQAQSGGDGLLSQAASADAASMDAAQTAGGINQNVDSELQRILGQDSPLLSQARAEAARMANARGLQNSSMAAGMTYDSLVRNAMPMAQQNASQNFQRDMADTGFRQEASLNNARFLQEAGLFNAQQANQLASLEAELGTSVNVFNAEQLNRANELSAQLRTAMEQQNAEAYNQAALQLAELQYGAMIEQAGIDQQTNMFNADQQNRANELMAQLGTAIEQQNADAANQASMQLADLRREAQAQQAELNFASQQQQAAEQQAYNEQVIDAVTRLNQQYLQGEQAIDLATVQSQYQLLIQTNETAGNVFNNYMNAMGNIMADPKMSTSQIANATNNLKKMLQSSLNMISEINGMDFGESVSGIVNAGQVGGPGGGGGTFNPYPNDGPGVPYNPDNPNNIEGYA